MSKHEDAKNLLKQSLIFTEESFKLYKNDKKSFFGNDLYAIALLIKNAVERLEHMTKEK